jgi:tetratricopeptide (TPR) repeat protein
MLKQLVTRLRGAVPLRARAHAPERLDEARAYAARGAFEAAASVCRQLIAEDPACAPAHQLLGSVLAQQGRIEEGVRSLERAHALQPEDPAVLVDLGHAFCLRGDDAQALACYRNALALAPRHPLAALAAGNALQRLGRFDEAAEIVLAALAEDFDPRLVRAAVTLLDRLERHDEARALCARILATHPDHPEAHSGAGYLALKIDLDAELAARHLQRAAGAIEDDPDLWSNLGIALQELGQVDQALSCYEAALRLAPEHAAAQAHRGLCLLLTGNFDRGWPEYECRRLAPNWTEPPFDLPRWSEEDLGERRVLVHSEQGIGDEILFASCLPALIAAAGSTLIECNPKLVPIFARSFPGARVRSLAERMAPEGLHALEGSDLMVAAGSLPGRFLPHGPVRPFAGYLKADAGHVADIRRRLDALGDAAKVGISWRGGTRKTWGGVRSIPLPALLPVLRTAGLTFVNVQYGEVEAELQDLAQREGVVLHHFPEWLADFDRTAALVSALDLLISVDTAVVQLAGALGARTWAMVPLSPDWRYGMSGDAMPWYASVRLFRQSRYREWSDVIASVADSAAAYARRRTF